MSTKVHIVPPGENPEDTVPAQCPVVGEIVLSPEVRKKRIEGAVAHLAKRLSEQAMTEDQLLERESFKTILRLMQYPKHLHRAYAHQFTKMQVREQNEERIRERILRFIRMHPPIYSAKR